MGYSENSISNTFSKISTDEEMSIFRASLEDAAKRLTDGAGQGSISNEEIGKNDMLLETYRVTSDAIHGGMGSVWQVRHTGWGVDLAMKRPQPRFFAEGSRERRENFIAECEHWIDLGLHPNIVSCYYVREIGGVPTIFSEWMDGGSLKDRIRDGSLYTGTEQEVRERILDIAIQAARGLRYSHEQKLLHQDMKPGNLLLTKDWEAKIADFGLAKAQQQLEDRGRALSSGGTAAYSPREQLEGAPAARWMDVYAWALTVLRMYAGEQLWETGGEARERFAETADRCRIPLSRRVRQLLGACLTERPDGFDGICGTLSVIWQEETGAAYPRPEPDHYISPADILNNRALSYLDLGKPEEAEKQWAQALAANRHHPESVYNRSLWRWREGLISDLEAHDEILIRCRVNKRSEQFRTEILKETGPYGYPAGVSTFENAVKVRYFVKTADAGLENVRSARSHNGLYEVDEDRNNRWFAAVREGSRIRKTFYVGGAISHVSFSEDDRFLTILSKDSNGPAELETVQVGPFTYQAPWALNRVISAEQILENRENYESWMRMAEEQAAAGSAEEAIGLLERIMEIPGYEFDQKAAAFYRTLLEKADAVGLKDAQKAFSVQAQEGGFAVMAEAGSFFCLVLREHVFVYDYTGGLIRVIDTQCGANPQSAAVSPDGRLLLAGFREETETPDPRSRSCSGFLCAYDLEQGVLTRKIPMKNFPAFFAFHPSKPYAAVSCFLGDVGIYTCPECRHVRDLKTGKMRRYARVSWSPDGTTLFVPNTAENDLWAVTNSLSLLHRSKRLVPHKNNSLLTSEVSADGTLYLRGNEGHHLIECIDVLTGEPRAELYFDNGAVSAFSISPDSRFIAVGTDEGKLVFRSTRSLKQEAFSVYMEDNRSINAVRWRPDAQMILVKAHVRGAYDTDRDIVTGYLPEWQYSAGTERNRQYFEEHWDPGERSAPEDLAKKYWGIYEHFCPEAQEMALEHEFSCEPGRSDRGDEIVTVRLDGSEQVCHIGHKETPGDADAADFARFVRSIKDGDDAGFFWEDPRGGYGRYEWTFSRRGDLLLVLTPMAYHAFFRYDEFTAGIRISDCTR